MREQDIETSYWDNPTPTSLFGYRFHAGVGSKGSAVEKMKQVKEGSRPRATPGLGTCRVLAVYS